MTPTPPESAPTQDVVPLNHIDDPFLTLRDDELKPDNPALREAYLIRLLVEDLSRGLYSVGRIREKYLGDGNYHPYSWLTTEKLAELLEQAVNRMVNDNPIDVRYEIVGYLTSNLGLQETLYKMLDDSQNQGKTRTSVEITRILNQLKKERVDFMREIGLELAKQAKDPSIPSILPPGAIPVTDLLAQGDKILERTNVPDQYKGVLTSGDISPTGRNGTTAGTLEEEQDPMDSAGSLF